MWKEGKETGKKSTFVGTVNRQNSVKKKRKKEKRVTSEK